MTYQAVVDLDLLPTELATFALDNLERRVVVEVAAGNRVIIAPKQLTSPSVSAHGVDERVAVTQEHDDQGSFTRIRFGRNVGSTQFGGYETPVGRYNVPVQQIETHPLGDVECYLDLPANTQLTVQLAGGGRSESPAAAYVQRLNVTVVMEPDTTLHAEQCNAAVRVVERVGGSVLGTFSTRIANGNDFQELNVAGNDTGHVRVAGNVDVPPVLADHHVFDISRLTMPPTTINMNPVVFVLLGNSGAGKSTVANHMTQKLNETGRQVVRYTEFPVLLEMARRGDGRLELHTDRNGFEMRDASAYQDALQMIAKQMTDELRSSTTSPVFILDLAPTGTYVDSVKLPKGLLEAAHVMYVETDPELCISRMQQRASLPGSDNHGFDADTWRSLFRNNHGFILQLAEARESHGPIVCAFNNHAGSDLVRASRQFAEYGLAISTVDNFQQALGLSDHLLTLPAQDVGLLPSLT